MALLRKVGPCEECGVFYGQAHDDEEHEGEIQKACKGRAAQRKRYLDEIARTR